MDESGMSLNYPLVKCWMKQGEQKRLPAYSDSRKGCLLAGVINWAKETVHCQSLLKNNSENLIAFFEWLFEEVYPSQKLVLVLDNSSPHQSASLKAALSLYEDRVLIFWLPTYSPDMNLIERFWKHLKQRVLCNQLYASVAALLAAIQAELTAQNNPDYEFRFSFSKYL
jgi:transposase